MDPNTETARAHLFLMIGVPQRVTWFSYLYVLINRFQFWPKKEPGNIRDRS